VPKRNTLALKNRYSTLRSRHNNSKTASSTKPEQVNSLEANKSTEPSSTAAAEKQSYEELPDWEDGDDDSLSDDGSEEQEHIEARRIINGHHDGLGEENPMAMDSKRTHGVAFQDADSLQLRLPWESSVDGIGMCPLY
jgi:hypothetical protein